MEEKHTAPAAIVRIHRPDISPEERARRMEEIKRAAINLIVATERQKAAKTVAG